MIDTPTTFDPALIYHAASVQGHGEYRAADWLERDGYSAFIPSRSVIVRRPGGKHLVRRPVFPCYVFVGRSESQSALDILRIPGVRSLVVADGKPAVMPLWMMRQLAAFDEMGAHEKPAHRFRPGDKVRLVDEPPFGGLIAEVMRAPEGRRMAVLLSLFGKQHMLQVQPHKVEAA